MIDIMKTLCKFIVIELASKLISDERAIYVWFKNAIAI